MRVLFYRVSYLLLMMALISAVSFAAVNMAPNSFFSSGELNPNITPEALENLKRVYGLDKPILQRYIDWVSAIFRFDFGISFASGKAVKEEIFDRIGVTLTINLISMAVVFAVALWLGIWAASRENSAVDRFVKRFSTLSFAMPSFYLAVLSVLVFSLWLGLFPLSGLHGMDVEKGGVLYWLDAAWHLVLPVFVVVFCSIGSLALYVRSLSLEILKSDYIFFAAARGADTKRLVFGYLLPNLSAPIVTMLGLSLPGVIGGSVILESVFSINGMGLLFFQSAMSRDYPVIMGIVMTGAFLTLLGNLLADMVLAKINPFFRP